MKGFTLIETLLAVLILSVAIAGPLTIAATGLQATRVTRDQVIAGFLAQDAMEYIRFVRDTNRLNNKHWLAGLNGTPNGHTTGGSNPNCTGTVSGGVYTGNYCIVDSLADQIAFCGTSLSTCSTIYLYYIPVTGGHYTYQTAGNGKSIFSRTISIALPSDNAKEADVTVRVQWVDRGRVLRSVELRDNLYDWH